MRALKKLETGVPGLDVLTMGSSTSRASPSLRARTPKPASTRCARTLILTDDALPRQSGVWLIQHAEAEGLIQGRPVLIVTAHPSVEGADNYEVIHKPFDPGPRTFILGYITNPELVLELLADCEMVPKN